MFWAKGTAPSGRVGISGGRSIPALKHRATQISAPCGARVGEPSRVPYGDTHKIGREGSGPIFAYWCPIKKAEWGSERHRASGALHSRRRGKSLLHSPSVQCFLGSASVQPAFSVSSSQSRPESGIRSKSESSPPDGMASSSSLIDGFPFSGSCAREAGASGTVARRRSSAPSRNPATLGGPFTPAGSPSPWEECFGDLPR